MIAPRDEGFQAMRSCTKFAQVMRPQSNGMLSPIGGFCFLGQAHPPPQATEAGSHTEQASWQQPKKQPLALRLRLFHQVK